LDVHERGRPDTSFDRLAARPARGTIQMLFESAGVYNEDHVARDRKAVGGRETSGAAPPPRFGGMRPPGLRAGTDDLRRNFLKACFRGRHPPPKEEKKSISIHSYGIVMFQGSEESSVLSRAEKRWMFETIETHAVPPVPCTSSGGIINNIKAACRPLGDYRCHPQWAGPEREPGNRFFRRDRPPLVPILQICRGGRGVGRSGQCKKTLVP